MKQTEIALVGVVLLGIAGAVVAAFLYHFDPSALLAATTPEVLVALGTGALAAAAIYTVAWDREKQGQETAWRSTQGAWRKSEDSWRAKQAVDRQKHRAPHLEILWRGKELERRNDPSISSLDPPEFTYHASTLVLVNNGPGIAANISGKRTIRTLKNAEVLEREEDRYNRDPRDEDDRTFKEQVEAGLSEETDPSRKVGRAFLKAGEEVTLESPDDVFQATNDMTEWYAYFWEVRATDIDGEGPSVARGGLVFQFPYEEKNTAPEDLDDDRRFHETNSRWKFASSLKPLPKRPPAKRVPPEDGAETEIPIEP